MQATAKVDITVCERRAREGRVHPNVGRRTRGGVYSAQIAGKKRQRTRTYAIE